MTPPIPDANTPSPQPDPMIEAHYRIYKGDELVKDVIVCDCGLYHVPPMTHELHELIVAEIKIALTCDDCVYGRPSPHMATQPLVRAALSSGFPEVGGDKTP